MRLARLAGAVLAVLAIPAAPAQAADGQVSVIQDDPLLLSQGPDVRNRTLEDMRTLGADVVRVSVQWRSVAPKPDANRRPRFEAKNPAAYGGPAWDVYDEVVRGAQARGMAVLLTPTSPVPQWASRCRDRKPADRRACKPDSKQFAAFVQALGHRYSGAYTDENQGNGVLPRVSLFSIWNEPNIAGHLNPQYAMVRGTRIAYSAYLYRALATRAIKALARTGHGAGEVLLGETAPIGRSTGPLSTRPVAPRIFVRELFCLTKRGRRLSGRAARARGCKRRFRFKVGGYAHHPYSRGGSQPPTARSAKDDITMSSLSRLSKALDAGARAGRIPRRLPIHLTEYGFQTDPPDRLFGVTEVQQARFINQSDYMAWRNRRVVAVGQYKVVDEPKVAGFQTGLRFIDGRTKDAYQAYRLPLWIQRRGSELVVYGQVRPAAPGARVEVQLQNGGDNDGPFSTVQTIVVESERGHFTSVVPYQSGTWRLRWQPAGGFTAVNSRVATPAG